MHNDKKIELLAHNIAKVTKQQDMDDIESAMDRLTANGGAYLDDAIELANRVTASATACKDEKAAMLLADVAAAILHLPIAVQHHAAHIDTNASPEKSEDTPTKEGNEETENPLDDATKTTTNTVARRRLPLA